MPKGLSQIPTLTREQSKLLERLMGGLYGSKFDITQSKPYQQALEQLAGVSQYAQDLMSPDSQAYQAYKAPMMREFQEQIIPGISERFAGLGGLSSSGFQQTAAQAGSGLEERLAALRTGLQMQGAGLQSQLAQQQFGMGMAPYEMALQRAQLALGTPGFGYYQKQPKQPGTFAQLMGGLAPGLGQGIGSGIGSAFGGLIGRLF